MGKIVAILFLQKGYIHKSMMKFDVKLASKIYSHQLINGAVVNYVKLQSVRGSVRELIWWLSSADYYHLLYLLSWGNEARSVGRASQVRKGRFSKKIFHQFVDNYVRTYREKLHREQNHFSPYSLTHRVSLPPATQAKTFTFIYCCVRTTTRMKCSDSVEQQEVVTFLLNHTI